MDIFARFLRRDTGARLGLAIRLLAAGAASACIIASLAISELSIRSQPTYRHAEELHHQAGVLLLALELQIETAQRWFEQQDEAALERLAQRESGSGLPVSGTRIRWRTPAEDRGQDDPLFVPIADRKTIADRETESRTARGAWILEAHLGRILERHTRSLPHSLGVGLRKLSATTDTTLETTLQLRAPSTPSSEFLRTTHPIPVAQLAASSRMASHEHPSLMLELTRPLDRRALPLGSSTMLGLLAASLVGVLTYLGARWLESQVRSREVERTEDLRLEVEHRKRLGRQLRRRARINHVMARALRVHLDDAPLEDLVARVLEELRELPCIPRSGRVSVHLLSAPGSPGAISDFLDRDPSLRLCAEAGGTPKRAHVSAQRIEEICCRCVQLNIAIHEPGPSDSGCVRLAGAAVPIRTRTRALGALYADVEPTEDLETTAEDLLADAAEILAHFIDRKLAHDQLQASVRTLESSRTQALERAGAQASLLTQTSHRLRTPLTSILGFSQFLAEEATLDEESRDAVEVIRANAEQLHDVIRQLVQTRTDGFATDSPGAAPRRRSGGILAPDTAPSPAAARAGTQPLSGFRLLLAEDNEVNRILIVRMLETSGAEVESVPDGAQAVERTQLADRDGNPFDAIVMDINMPVLDGIDATQTLRAEGNSVPILALTASDVSEDHARCIDAGFDAVHSKPVDRDRLAAAIWKLCCPSR